MTHVTRVTTRYRNVMYVAYCYGRSYRSLLRSIPAALLLRWLPSVAERVPGLYRGRFEFLSVEDLREDARADRTS